jgi:alpha-tubulin suppressor-like RCC1 family protein
LRLKSSVLVIAALAIALTGCKRKKPLAFDQVWLGPTGGCAAPAGGGRTVLCWGANDHGQAGDGTTQARPTALALTFAAATGVPTELALGARHGCGVFDRSRVACWGDGAEGQLGGAKLASQPTPTIVSGVPAGAALEVKVGAAHTCLRAAAQVRCFGANGEGQLGPASEPDPWTTGAAVIALALGDAHTCVGYGRTSSAREHVVCRGRGFPPAGERLLEGAFVTALAAGSAHTCALLGDGTVRCWGKNDAGQLGDGTTNDGTAPTSVIGLRDVVEIAAGARHTCARLVSHAVACWGDNRYHQLSNGTTAAGSRPAVIPGLFGVEQVAAAGDAACVRLGGGEVRCWGRNDVGQLGDGSTVEHDVPMSPKLP